MIVLNLAKQVTVSFILILLPRILDFWKDFIVIFGPCPVNSINYFSYYAFLVDDFSCYMWFIPLKNKSDFFHKFCIFINFLNRQFSKHIRIFQSAGGGEFTSNALTSFLQDNGIVHYIFCPNTLEQNGVVE